MPHHFVSWPPCSPRWRWRPPWPWPGPGPRADVVPPAGTWAEIFDSSLHANGITLCADDPNGSTAQFQALQLRRCHGYASNGVPQRWTFYYVANNFLGPTANAGGPNWCLGLDVRITLTKAYSQWQGSNLVQEACSVTTGSEVRVEPAAGHPVTRSD